MGRGMQGQKEKRIQFIGLIILKWLKDLGEGQGGNSLKTHESQNAALPSKSLRKARQIF